MFPNSKYNQSTIKSNSFKSEICFQRHEIVLPQSNDAINDKSRKVQQFASGMHTLSMMQKKRKSCLQCNLFILYTLLKVKLVSRPKIKMRLILFIFT